MLSYRQLPPAPLALLVLLLSAFTSIVTAQFDNTQCDEASIAPTDLYLGDLTWNAENPTQVFYLVQIINGLFIATYSNDNSHWSLEGRGALAESPFKVQFETKDAGTNAWHLTNPGICDGSKGGHSLFDPSGVKSIKLFYATPPKKN